MRAITDFLKFIIIVIGLIILFAYFGIVDRYSRKEEVVVEKPRNGSFEIVNGEGGFAILKGAVFNDPTSKITISLTDVNTDNVRIYCTSPNGDNDRYYLDNGETATILGKDDNKYQIMPIFIEKENYAIFKIDLIESSIKKSAVSKKFEETIKTAYDYRLQVGDSFDEHELHLHINSIDNTKQIVYAECIYPKYNSKNAELEAGRYYGYNLNGKMYRFKVTDIEPLTENSYWFRIIFEEEVENR
jgi:hypothetical protein